MSADSIEVRGRVFELVVRRRTGVAVYRGDGAYLRIGDAITPELEVHRRMLAEGYPVPEVLEVGEHGGSPYVIEASVGAATLGDLWEERARSDGTVSDGEYTVFRGLMLRWARAQVAGEARPWQRDDLAGLLGVRDAARHLPDLAPSIEAAFTRAVSDVHDLPGALQHDDLHPYNMCEHGVIDLEGVRWATAGYDVTTAILEPSLAEPRWHDHRLSLTWFTEAQVEDYLAALDVEFRDAPGPPPSMVADAYLICRAISRCAHRHPDPGVREARRDALAGLLPSFLDGVRPLVAGGRGA